MMFKNSLKLITANFTTVWKLILYYIIVCALIVGLIYPVSGTLYEGLNAGGAVDSLFDCATSLNASSHIFNLLQNLYVALTSIFSAFITLFSTHTFVAIYSCFVVFYLMPFLFGLADLPVQETLYGYMSSLTRYGFLHCYIRKFGKSALFQLFKDLIMLPINCLLIYVFVQILSLTTLGGPIIYAIPFIVVIVMCILTTLKVTLFSGWIPACVVYDCNMFVGLAKGFTAIFRRFWKSFSTVLMFMFCIFAVNYLFGTFAFIITIPTSIMLLNIFGMVMFYGSQGMRYYVDLDTIVSPRKLEEKDEFRKIKNLI